MEKEWRECSVLPLVTRGIYTCYPGDIPGGHTLPGSFHITVGVYDTFFYIVVFIPHLYLI